MAFFVYWKKTWEQLIMTKEHSGLDMNLEPVEGSVHDHIDAEPSANWATISQFVVQVNKQSKVVAPIYANGRQQVPIEILIQARDTNGVAVNLTNAQLKSIRLIEYDTGAAVGNVSDTKVDRYIYHWTVTREDENDVNEVLPSGSDSPEIAAQTVIKYVHKNLVSTNWIAAEITSPGGAVFRTNTPNPTAGKFDSWIKLQARQMLIFDYSCLQVARVDEVTVPFWDVDFYYISFKDPNMRIVWSVHPDTPANTAHSNCRGGNGYYGHVAYLRDVRRRVGYSGGLLPGLEYYVNQRDGSATVARVSAPENYLGGRHDSACVIYVNQHGNEARCNLQPNAGDNHNTMSLEKWEH